MLDETNAAVISSARGGDGEKVMHLYVSIKAVDYFTVDTNAASLPGENKHGQKETFTPTQKHRAGSLQHSASHLCFALFPVNT